MFLTALNVSQIARDHLIASFFTGFAISWVWWVNAHSAAHDNTRAGQAVYALGAGLGTATGVFVMRLLA